MTLVTLGSPGLQAGKSPDFLVLRGLARAGRSRVKVPGARILSRNVASARSWCSGGKSRDGIGRGGQGVRKADLVRGDARGHFPTEQAALKCLYLAIMSLDPTGKGRKRWTNRWKAALNAFDITFDGRLSAGRK